MALQQLRYLIVEALTDETVQRALLNPPSGDAGYWNPNTSSALAYYASRGFRLEAGEASLILALLGATAEASVPALSAVSCCVHPPGDPDPICLVAEAHEPFYDGVFILRLRKAESKSVETIRTLLSALKAYFLVPETPAGDSQALDAVHKALNFCFAEEPAD